MKAILSAALIGLAMASCSENEIFDDTQNAGNVISFAPSASKLTKAPVLDNFNASSFDFGVYAYYTGQDVWNTYDSKKGLPNFMSDQKVAHDGSVWAYSPVKYWPNTTGDKLSFFAYMPKGSVVAASPGTASGASATASVTSGSLPTIDFTQEVKDPKQMVDFTVAQMLNQTKRDGNVTLPFKHVLTRLNFGVKASTKLAAKTTIKVTGLRILGTDNQSGVNPAADNSGINNDSRFFSTGEYTLASDGTNGVWDLAYSTKVKKALDLSTILRTGTDLEIKTDEQKPVLTDGEYVFLIPPYGKEGVKDEKDIRIQVDYTTVTADPTLGNVKHSATAMFSMPNGSLKEGKAYNAVLIFGMNEVKFALNQELWDTEEDTYPVTSGDAQTAAEIEEQIKDALDAGNDVVVNYDQAPKNPLDITIPTVTSAKAITLNLLNQTAPVSITTNVNYTGKLTINAPLATVTIGGGTYYKPTAKTAGNTLVIAAGTTVDGLVVKKGNVEVYGTLTGDVTTTLPETDKPTITKMSDAANISGDITGFTVKDLSDAGVYYRIDGGEWIIAPNDYSVLTGKSIELRSNNEDQTISYANYEILLANSNFIEFDLSKVTVSGVNQNTGKIDAIVPHTKVVSIKYPEGVTFCWKEFKACTDLEFIQFPNTMESIAALGRMHSLTTVVLPDKELEILYDAFRNCKNLRYINLSDKIYYRPCGPGYNGTTNILGYQFAGCENLEIESVDFSNYKFPEYDTYKCIPIGVFEGCKNLKRVDFGSNAEIKTIGYCAFKNTSIEGDITLPVSLTELGQEAFAYTQITSLIIPNSLTQLNKLFGWCSNVTSFTIPEHVTTLNSTFMHSHIEHIIIPKTVKKLMGAVIAGNTKAIKTVVFDEPDTPRDLRLPLGMFHHASELTTVTLPSDVIALENRTFMKSSKLHTIICKATKVPTTMFEDFGFVEKGINYYTGALVPEGTNKVLYVPAGLVDDYQAETTDGKDLTVVKDEQGNITSTNENYWKTVLIDQCGFVVKSISELPD